MMAAGFQFSVGAFKEKEITEITRERLDKYLENMEHIFLLNRRFHPVTGNKVDFDDEEKKNILCIEGGAEIQDLFKHEGKVLDGDTYALAIQKVRAALPQGKQTFDVWHRKILESARRVDWEDYGFEKAVVDAVLIQTSSMKLRQKALQDNPDWNQLVDMGIGQEQSQKKA